MAGAIGKAERLLHLEMLLATHPEGLRKSEIAERLAVNRSTAGRYITELTGILPLVEEHDGRIWLDLDRYLRLVRLSPPQIESIHLAFRLFRRKIRLPFPHAAAALRALAIAAERASPGFARGLAESADSLDGHAFPRFTHRYQEPLERLIEAAAASRTVVIRHRSRRRGHIPWHSARASLKLVGEDGNATSEFIFPGIPPGPAGSRASRSPASPQYDFSWCVHDDDAGQCMHRSRSFPNESTAYRR